MPEATVPRNTVRLTCPCGAELLIPGQNLGHTMACPTCKRYLRPALQFLLIDASRAPNLTVQCACGHFVVEKPNSAGKQTRCAVCKRGLIMPQPIVKFGSPGLVRVPRKVLERQLRRGQARRERASKEMTRLESAAHAGRISLRPGEHICVNLHCGALLRAGARVCSKCATNRVTGKRYEGMGPQGDPKGKWREP